MKSFFKRGLQGILIMFLLFNVIVNIHTYKLSHFQEDYRTETERLEKTPIWKTILMGTTAYKTKITEIPSQAFDTLFLWTSDSLKLESWWIPTDSAKGNVLILHGHGSNKSRKLCESDYFHELGYNVLLLDFRAHGNSEGSFCTIGYVETEDIALAYRLLEEKNDLPNIIWGMSMGAASALKAIPEHHLDPDKLIIECSFATLPEAIGGRLRMMGLPEQLGFFVSFWASVQSGMWTFGYQPEEYAKEIDLPTLIQWGSLDPRVSESETMRILENLQGLDKNLVIYENSAHQSYCDHESERWKESVRNFLSR